MGTNAAATVSPTMACMVYPAVASSCAGAVPASSTSISSHLQVSKAWPSCTSCGASPDLTQCLTSSMRTLRVGASGFGAHYSNTLPNSIACLSQKHFSFKPIICSRSGKFQSLGNAKTQRPPLQKWSHDLHLTSQV